MNATLLHAVVRVADARTPDADLLARFVRAQDGIAFEELVRRHGPLVWAVCRQLLPHHADAEDAFQAVFLALVRGAGRIRSGQALPAWLHGVAVRAATKAKRTAARRRQREARAAVPEADRPVPDASWGGLMAAVHEEVQRLPDAERVAFVLCELEGVRQPDAAARLGWPLGTLSGRLSKARQRLLDQLTRRGIAPAMLVVGGLAGSAGSVPAALILKANSFPKAIGIPSTVAELARGLVEGVTMRTKLLAAAVVVAGAIGVGGGAMVLTTAGAQDPDVIKETKELLGGLVGADGQPPSPDGGGANQPGAAPGRPKAGGATGGFPGGPGGGLGGPPGQNIPGMPGPGMTGMGGMGMAMGMAAGHTHWEYKFVDLGGEDRSSFEKAITSAGNDGWEFGGSERFRKGNEAAQLTLVFKRPKGGAAMGGMMGGGGFGRGGGGGEFGGGGRGGPGGMIGGGPGSEGGGRGGPGTPGGEGGGRGRPGGPGEGTAAPGPGGRGPGAGGSGEGSEGPPMPGRAPGVVPGGAMPGPGGFPGGPGGRPAPGGPMGMPGAPGGYGPGGFGEGGMPSMPGGPSPRASGLTVLTLKHATANEMASVLGQVFGVNKATITVDGRTNQLIVRADDDTLKELVKLLEALDVEVPKKR